MPDHPVKSRIEQTGLILLLTSIVLGPLYVGSYYEDWRKPLLVVASLSIILLAACSFKLYKRTAVLLLIVSLLSLQAVWMWYNAWGEFTRDTSSLQPWSIRFLEHQPFPSVPGSSDRAETWDRISYVLVCLWLVWTTRNLIISGGSQIVRLLLKTIFITGVILAALGLIQQWTGAESTYWVKSLKHNYQLFFATYRSPGIASAYLNLAMAAGLALLLNAGSNSRFNASPHYLIGITTLKILGITIILCATMATGSKAGSVFGLITLITWATINYKAILSAYHRSQKYFLGNRRLERNLVAIVLLTTAIVAVLSFAGNVVTRWDQAEKKKFGTLQGRMEVNKVIIDSLSDPDMEWGALGHGPGSFYTLFPVINKSHAPKTKGLHVYAHNDFLQTLFEWGWLGFSLFTSLIAGGYLIISRELFLCRSKHRRSSTLYLRGCLIGMTIMLLHATVDFPFQIESIAVTFSIILGIAWAAPTLRINKHHHRKRNHAVS